MYVYNVVVKVHPETEIRRTMEAERYLRAAFPELPHWFIYPTSEPTQMSAVIRTETNPFATLAEWLRRLPDAAPFEPGSLLFFNGLSRD